ncbi:MAG: transposase [Campylobacterales bacterium]|nr:transposase [Campylobacterales bacterium]
MLYANDRLSICTLPPYSPQLNPVERFFYEVRRDTSNRIYSSLRLIRREN